jgi:hypothetical protein
MIKQLGSVLIPLGVYEKAIKIQDENINNKWPSTYLKHEGTDQTMIKTLSKLLSCKEEDVDYVYFSSRSGAETHVDKLPLDKFGLDTIIIPLIIPEGANRLTVGPLSVVVYVDQGYLFHHQTPHSFEVSADTGCVLIMAAKRISTDHD